MPYTVRDHYRHTNRMIEEYQQYTGVTVLWYEWDPDTTTVDDLYDEGPSRRWMVPKPMPVYSLVREEGTEVPSAEGHYPVDTIHAAALLEQLRKYGLSDPYDAQRHLHDRFIWDGFVWEVRRWAIQGRTRTYEATVGIDAYRVMPDELVNDPDFAVYAQT